MKRDVALWEKWIEALRSGDYQQGENNLIQTNGNNPLYCCLGVLCDVSGEPTVAEDGSGFEFSDAFSEDFLPDSFRTKVGLSDDDQHCLAELNDDYGHNFLDIADILEEALRDGEDVRYVYRKS